MHILYLHGPIFIQILADLVTLIHENATSWLDLVHRFVEQLESTTVSATFKQLKLMSLCYKVNKHII